MCGGTSVTFLEGSPLCLLERPKFHMPKNPEEGREKEFGEKRARRTCRRVCADVCASPGEAGSPGRGRSWISHILTLPSSEHDISSLKQRRRPAVRWACTQDLILQALSGGGLIRMRVLDHNSS
ncbi:hypothetical protein EYF80_032786 [Liparis tanakae]|uniref:Uncharacterized protein n=1 Tax=Liparis tanakae TaxID=230148 RepID=A0A4Z2GV50_9TELE|nr:hypothetical protein EYF80_032786 [Liparis tanakae]